MQVGDLVMIKVHHFRNPGLIGIIIEDVCNAGKAFRVLLSNGEISRSITSDLEVLDASG